MSFIDNDNVFIKVSTATNTVVNTVCFPDGVTPSPEAGFVFVSNANHQGVGIGFTYDPVDESFTAPVIVEG